MRGEGGGALQYAREEEAGGEDAVGGLARGGDGEGLVGREACRVVVRREADGWLVVP